MKTKFVFFGLMVALVGCADSDVGGRLVVRSDMNTDPTCATATADGSMCVSGALETNGALDVAGASTLTGAVTTAATTTHTGDVTMSGGASALTFSGSASSIVVDDNDTTALLIGSTGQLNLVTIDTGNNTETVVITGTTAADALHVDVGTVQLDELLTASGGIAVEGADPVAIPLDSLRFCGQGPNATTAVYLSPDTFDGNGTAPGSAHCDAEDNTTEATADEVLFNYAILVTGMRCEISASGTDDVLTFQLRDDTADVTGMTCNVTLDGTAKTCQVLDSTPATIAAGSAIAMDVVADTDDDVSAADVLCTIYYVN